MRKLVQLAVAAASIAPYTLSQMLGIAGVESPSEEAKKEWEVNILAVAMLLLVAGFYAFIMALWLYCSGRLPNS